MNKKINFLIRSNLLSLSILLILSACSYGPPKESGEFLKPDLVELTELDSTFKLDIRYSTSNNFLGKAVYSQATAFLQRPAAEALVRVSKSLKRDGYGIIVFDGYRLWSVTKLFWDSATEEERQAGFVADPAKGSRHNRGCAVDISLYDLKTGLEVKMPSGYDEFTERAFSNYIGGDKEATRLRDLLITAMESEGFTVLEQEWWHFDYKDWPMYPILNVDFEDL
ncbi:MAG TPA: M15 family metallopeptidase [Melioribacteraceae bacterium]|nr:M15 family metallopeptidase [Melioribacteraceae bacterium]